MAIEDEEEILSTTALPLLFCVEEKNGASSRAGTPLT